MSGGVLSTAAERNTHMAAGEKAPNLRERETFQPVGVSTMTQGSSISSPKLAGEWTTPVLNFGSLLRKKIKKINLHNFGNRTK